MGSTVGSSASPTPAQEALSLGLKLAGALALLGVGVAFAAYLYREPLTRFGSAIVTSLGYPGMGLGTFLSDGFHFPIPPQFYMLAAIAGGGSQVAALVAIAIGSVLGGHAGYFVAKSASRLAFVQRGTEKVLRTLAPLIARHGAAAIVIASILPVPYSFLCYVAGLDRLPYRLFALLVCLRIPKILLYYFMIRAGWSI